MSQLMNHTIVRRSVIFCQILYSKVIRLKHVNVVFNFINDCTFKTTTSALRGRMETIAQILPTLPPTRCRYIPCTLRQIPLAEALQPHKVCTYNR